MDNSFSIRLLHRPLEDNIRVVRFSSFFEILRQVSSVTFEAADMSFNFRCLTGKVAEEDEDGISCSFCFIARGCSVLYATSSV